MIYFRSLIVSYFFFSFISLYASNIEELNTLISNNSISIYGVNATENKVQSSYEGIGLSYNAPDMKLKVEGSDDSFKTALALHFNPFKEPWYVTFGANYINQNLPTINENISQYSATLGGGHMLYNNFYFEIGNTITQQNGIQTDMGNENKIQKINNIYMAIAKRIDTPIGAIDATFRGSQIYKTLSTKEESYKSGINYYPNNNIKLAYAYTNKQNNISDWYSLNYGYFMTEITNNISQDSCNVIIGIKANFKDITDFSSYMSPTKIQSKLPLLHKLDDVVLHENMKVFI